MGECPGKEDEDVYTRVLVWSDGNGHHRGSNSNHRGCLAAKEVGGKIMKYAVEARIFNNGKIVAKVRPVGEYIWVDIFETEREAREFAAGYRKA